ncbi:MULTISPECIES: hypothetical protein [Streptomyces]|uniref:Uncharacterized protein n=1 Tax=Streptomyces sviceus (strain ATCC 29083 / DSM 924 / JCM 4929 / NBRC 13980 / NCIMB 11184 / NRRL 5439 / UC 5370) TaxID=463191 RepID=B5I119_STRX2|nr:MULTISPECIES: hypothetical protein [Streptomyces]EDY58774.1 predicted protein [Streptomyces sviceus ATCC 29083]
MTKDQLLTRLSSKAAVMLTRRRALLAGAAAVGAAGTAGVLAALTGEEPVRVGAPAVVLLDGL